MIPIDRPMEVVRAALTNDIDLSAFGTSEGSIVVGDSDAEFSHVLNANRNDRQLSSAPGDDVVSNIDAIEIEYILIAAGAGNGATAIAEACARRLEGRGHRLQ